MFLFLITAQAVITCQYDPFAPPGYHGEVRMPAPTGTAVETAHLMATRAHVPQQCWMRQALDNRRSTA